MSKTKSTAPSPSSATPLSSPVSTSNCQYDMTLTEKLKISDAIAEPECWDLSMMEKLHRAVEEVLYIKNGLKQPSEQQVDGELSKLLNCSLYDDPEQYIEDALPKDPIMRKYDVDRFMACIENLCRHMLRIVKEIGPVMKLKRLNETERKKEETVRKQERDELEECNRKLKEVQEELSTYKEEVDRHRISRIESQDKLIEAQNCLIELQGRKLNSVTESVQKQLQGYSKVLVQNCSAAIAPSRLQAAWKKLESNSSPSKYNRRSNSRPKAEFGYI